MNFRILPLLRQAPLTLACVTVCAALFFLTHRPLQTISEKRQALHNWGAIVEMVQGPMVDGSPADPELMIHGPLALWQGQWWRVPICALHHADFWHLLLNSLAAVYFGRLLEPRWGSWRMLWFLPGAVIIPIIPELLAGNYVVGFSGMVTAMFGLVCVLRTCDESLREEFPDEAVQMGGVLLALGVWSTALDLVPVANLAHMTGFCWGALAGWATTEPPHRNWKPRLARSLLGLAMVPAVWLAMHPFWNGNYIWWTALRESTNAEQRLTRLHRAVRLDPQLIGAWRQLAGESLRRGETMHGWMILLQGLAHNPSNANLLQEAHRVWRIVLFDPGRAAASQAIEDVFGDLASAWMERFRNDPAGRSPADAVNLSSSADIDPTVLFSLDQALDLRLPDLPTAEEEGRPPSRQIPPAGDAVEGEQL